MIGTTFKLGFDGTSVNRGLSSIKGVLGRFGKEVSIGAARKIGYGLVEGITALIQSIPEATKEMMDWSGELVDMSAQTKMSTEDLMVLQEALRMAGFKGDAGNVLVTFKKNLYDASQGAEEMQKALNKIHIGGSDLKNLKLVDQFRIVGQAIVAMGDDFDGLESVVSTLFGGKGGKQFLKFFADFKGSMDQARKNVGKFASESKDLLPIYDEISDNLGRWDMVRRELMSNVLQGFFGINGTSGVANAINTMMDYIRDLGGPLREFGTFARQIFMSFKELIDKHGFFGAIIENMKAGAKVFGETVGQAIKDALNPFSNIPGFGWMKSAPKPKETRQPIDVVRDAMGLPRLSPPKGDNTKMLEQMHKESQKQTVYLEKIYRENGTAMFA